MSVAGRFHAFDLAGQLRRRGHLQQLITSYPRAMAVGAGIPAKYVKSLLLKEFIFRAWARAPRPVRKMTDLRYSAKDIFDRQVARRLAPCDIFIGWSGSCLRSLRRARDLGAATLVVRGSSHILFAERIISEEYRQLGLERPKNHPKNIQKELDEYREADFIVVPSEFARRSFVEMGLPPKKVVKIVCGVDLEIFRPFPKRDGVFRVICTGTMSIPKGTHHLLRAFSELNLPNSELVLIGRASREIKPFFEQYRGKFRFLGRYPREQLAPHYSQGSVFAFMSLSDGWGLVITEAMSCGLPVICTRNTGGPDIVREGREGFIVSVRDLEALKDKIRFLYQNPAIRERMGREARKRAAGFTWNDYGNRAETVFRGILENKRDRSPKSYDRL